MTHPDAISVSATAEELSSSDRTTLLLQHIEAGAVPLLEHVVILDTPDIVTVLRKSREYPDIHAALDAQFESALYRVKRPRSFLKQHRFTAKLADELIEHVQLGAVPLIKTLVSCRAEDDDRIFNEISKYPELDASMSAQFTAYWARQPKRGME